MKTISDLNKVNNIIRELIKEFDSKSFTIQDFYIPDRITKTILENMMGIKLIKSQPINSDMKISISRGDNYEELRCEPFPEWVIEKLSRDQQERLRQDKESE